MSTVGLKPQSRGCLSHRCALHRPSRNVRCRADAASGMTTIGKHLQDYGGALIPGCYDALSARLMAKQGYKVRSHIHVKREYALNRTLLIPCTRAKQPMLALPELGRAAHHVRVPLIVVPWLKARDPRCLRACCCCCRRGAPGC